MMNNPTRGTIIGNPMRTHYPCGACQAYVARCRHVSGNSPLIKEIDKRTAETTILAK